MQFEITKCDCISISIVKQVLFWFSFHLQDQESFMHMTSQLLSNCSIALHFLVSISAHVVMDKKLQYQGFYYSASICFIIVRNARRDVLACLNIRHFFLVQLFYSKKYICKYSYNKKSFFTEGNIVFRVNCTLKCEKIQRLFSKYRTEKKTILYTCTYTYFESTPC